MKRFTPFLTALAFASLFFGVEYFIYSRAQQSASWPTVKGKILKAHLSQNEEGTEFTARVSYEYFINGKKYLGDRIYYGYSGGSNAAKQQRLLYPVGKDVDVRYNPKKPSECTLKTLYSPSGFFSLGFLVVIIAFVLLFKKPKKVENKEKLGEDYEQIGYWYMEEDPFFGDKDTKLLKSSQKKHFSFAFTIVSVIGIVLVPKINEIVKKISPEDKMFIDEHAYIFPAILAVISAWVLWSSLSSLLSARKVLIDKKEGKIVYTNKAWSKTIEDYKIDYFDHVLVENRTRGSGNSTYTYYPVAFIGEKHRLVIDEKDSITEAKFLAEKLSLFLDKKIIDYCTDVRIEKQPKELEQSFREKLLSEEKEQETPQTPDQVSIEQKENALTVTFLTNPTTLLKPLAIILALIVGGAFISIAVADGGPIAIVMSLAVLFGVFKLYRFLSKMSKSLSKITISKEHLEIGTTVDEEVKSIAVKDIREMYIAGSSLVLFTKDEYVNVYHGEKEELEWLLATIKSTITK